jgi:hypothetical protein
MLAHESLCVGIDIGKLFHVAGFLSTTLLRLHERFEVCPALKFDQSRERFRLLVDRIRSFVPLEQCYVLYIRYNQRVVFLLWAATRTKFLKRLNHSGEYGSRTTVLRAFL